MKGKLRQGKITTTTTTTTLILEMRSQVEIAKKGCHVSFKNNVTEQLKLAIKSGITKKISSIFVVRRRALTIHSQWFNLKGSPAW